MNNHPVRDQARFVLYWMVAHRRTEYNHAVQRAVEWARELNRPLLILEALRCDYRWACDRFHRFVMEGMLDNLEKVRSTAATYFPYVEREAGAGKGLLQALSRQACVVVTDDFPAFFIPHMLDAASRKLPVRMEAIDSNGILPMRIADGTFKTAYSFRRFLQKNLLEHLIQPPVANPLDQLPAAAEIQTPRAVADNWPKLHGDDLRSLISNPRVLPIDHQVKATSDRGGSRAASERTKEFVSSQLPLYDSRHNHPDDDVTSRLSSYLHFGHISSHQIFRAVAEREQWSIPEPAPKAAGSRNGWWGMSEAAEAFLDQLITWRELGFNMCAHNPDHNRYESLPDWALKTLADHQADARPYLYSVDELEQAATHDPLWDAAQTQLLREGRIHNYLRMLWGKKILQWTESPRTALNTMIRLNDKYALDGRDPNSISGIFWILGRHDRAWGPERPVFGKIRYMSSRNTTRKLRVRDYLKRYNPSTE